MEAAQRQKLVELFEKEHLAVLITRGERWPTATLQAFAETAELDLTFIMIDTADKFINLTKRPEVTVMIDSRFSGERASLAVLRVVVQGLAREVPRGSAEWDALRPQFLTKNPFEAPYFDAPQIRMVRVRPSRISYAGVGRDNFKLEL